MIYNAPFRAKASKSSTPGIRLRELLAAALVLLVCSTAWGKEPLQYAELGDFPLENGSVIRNCRVAYTTFGTLNAGKSNVVLVPTWLAGTSQELADTDFIGPGKTFDSSKYFVIAMDAFGNGASSSPSNSQTQPGTAFPAFSIRDMVRAQYLVLSRHLNIRHIHAVAGISMGALQTFQWMVAYPDFMDMAIPVFGGPWMTSYDMLVWSAQLALLENINACKGNAAAMKALTPLHILLAWPPGYRVANTKPDAFPDFLAQQQEKLSTYDAINWARQVQAMLTHDILKAFGGSPEKAAATIRAKCFVITSPEDHISYPGEAKTFARLIGAKTAELSGECGHFAFFCDREKLRALVNAFLDHKGNAPALPAHGTPE